VQSSVQHRHADDIAVQLCIVTSRYPAVARQCRLGNYVKLTECSADNMCCSLTGQWLWPMQKNWHRLRTSTYP